MPLDAIDAFIRDKKIDTTRKDWRRKLPKPPQADFEPGETLFWNLETSEGPIRVRLMPDVAPMHVTSTAYLTRLGFYDGLVFHRIIPGFMAQGGCPTGDGRGGPGYTYEGEFSADVKHDVPGRLSMANAGPGTDGSQFFLTFKETPWLDGKHTVFGEVVEGQGVLEALEGKGSPSGAPAGAPRIERATLSTE